MIELKGSPDGSRPTCVQIASPNLPRPMVKVNTLEILAKDNRVLIQRMEFYSGEYAVVNCGVGSCPVKKYNEVL